MRLSRKIKGLLFTLLIVLNVILRFQVSFREIGRDSFEMHIMTNSLNEFGYAKWFLDPLSVIGLYPASYASSMHFLISGVHQNTNLQMNTVLFVYCMIIGILTIFTSYIVAKQFSNNDDLFAFMSAAVFSTLPLTLSLTTWTIPTRGLFVVMAPIVIYLFLKIISEYRLKYIMLILVYSLFLFATHHLFYFILPFFASVVLILFINTDFISSKIWHRNSIISKDKMLLYVSNPVFCIAGFILMFSIPFITGKFIEMSRYSAFYISYARYLGISIILALGGLLSLISKTNKNSKEWFILISAMLLTMFIYQETYMKNFIGIIAIFFISVGLLNVTKVTFHKKKYISSLLIIFLVSSIGISSYYQFIHDYGTNDRAVGDSSYYTGNWIKEKINEPCISNSLIATDRLFSLSETVHFLTASTTVNQIYGFNNINISQYERYSLKSDDFWLNGYKGPDVGESTWHAIHMLWNSPSDYSIRYVVEDTETRGNIVWGHGGVQSKLLQDAYSTNCIYNTGNYKIWDLSTQT